MERELEKLMQEEGIQNKYQDGTISQWGQTICEIEFEFSYPIVILQGVSEVSFQLNFRKSFLKSKGFTNLNAT